MISKMIDEVSHNDLSIDEQIDLLEELRKKIDIVVRKKIIDVKNRAFYCPFCGKFYDKVECNIDEFIENREVCVFDDLKVYEEKNFKITNIICPKGHKFKYEKILD